MTASASTIHGMPSPDDPRDARHCGALTQDGEPCSVSSYLLRWDPDAGDGGEWRCISHHSSEEVQQAAKLARQRGAIVAAERSRKSPRTLDPGSLGTLTDREDAKRVAGEIAVAVAEGRLAPTIANATLAALRLWSDLEDDAARRAVEKKMARKP